MKAVAWIWAEQLYHHCIMLNILSTMLHQIRKSERKKIQSSQTEWPDKAEYKTGLKEAGAVRSGNWWSSQSIQSRPGYQRSLEKDLPLGQTDA